MRLSFVWSCLLLALLPWYSSAQNTTPFEVTFYFETANHQNYDVDQAALAKIIAYSQQNPEEPLIVQGHTDDQGDTLSNLQLSKDRAQTIEQALIKAGIPAARIQIKALGEGYPLHDNNYAIGRQKNRRVEVFITNQVKTVHITQAVKNKRLLEKMRPAPTQFAIAANTKDTFFVTPQGTRVYVPAGAFEVADGQAVTVELREAYTFTDMLLNGLSTTSNGALLTTGGMFELKATSAGERVALRAGKELSIQVPTDSVLPEMQLYEMDTTVTATNWVNPRSLVVPPAFVSNRTGTFDHGFSCPSLNHLLSENRKQTVLEAKADSAHEAFRTYRIVGLKLFAGDSIARVIAMNEEKKNFLLGKYNKPCKGFFCKLGQLFEGKRARMAKDSAVLKCMALEEEQITLHVALEGQRSLEAAHRAKIDSSILVQRKLQATYSALKAAALRERNTTVQSAVFEKNNCASLNYPKVPDTLRSVVDADRRLAVYFYSKNFTELEHYYPQHEAIIAKHLYQVSTYRAAAKEQSFRRYYNKQDFDALQRFHPEREAEVCQELYQVATYEEAKREKRYQECMASKNLKQLEQEFPDRERETCQRLYNVETYAAAKQEKRERVFMRYCQGYNLEGLQTYFPEREREVCLLLYQVTTFEEALVLQERKQLLEKSFYSLQLSNKSLGRWMNLDYLRKLPKEELLVQTVKMKAPIMREDFLIYGDTKALVGPTGRSSTQSQFKDVVDKKSHTLISYYAIDDEHVALAVKTFDAKRGVAVKLDYEELTLEAFAERLATFN
ncbi:MAG: OmpA family protein [Aureispira sp.]